MSSICKECHAEGEKKSREDGNPNPHTWNDHTAGTKRGISIGPCEDCKTVGETVDCHVY